MQPRSLQPDILALRTLLPFGSTEVDVPEDVDAPVIFITKAISMEGKLKRKKETHLIELE